MAKYKKKPLIVEATQWYKNGDHPLDGDPKTEGEIVRYFRHPDYEGKANCKECGTMYHHHGWVETANGGHKVCPGDWIIKEMTTGYYPCKPDIFEKTYIPLK